MSIPTAVTRGPAPLQASACARCCQEHQPCQVVGCQGSAVLLAQVEGSLWAPDAVPPAEAGHCLQAHARPQCRERGQPRWVRLLQQLQRGRVWATGEGCHDGQACGGHGGASMVVCQVHPCIQGPCPPTAGAQLPWRSAQGVQAGLAAALPPQVYRTPTCSKSGSWGRAHPLSLSTRSSSSTLSGRSVAAWRAMLPSCWAALMSCLHRPQSGSGYQALAGHDAREWHMPTPVS